MIKVRLYDREKHFAAHDWATENLDRRDYWFRAVHGFKGIVESHWVWRFRHSKDAVICTLRFK
jgi:hypothetical protein